MSVIEIDTSGAAVVCTGEYSVISRFDPLLVSRLTAVSLASCGPAAVVITLV